jgi:hypothetical protein
MSTDSEKKRIERRVLEQFRQLLPSFPPGEITTGEEPDFTVALSSGGTLGIELTELYREVPTGQVPPQSQEALRHRAVKRAQDIYDAGGNPFLHASVHFANVQLAKTDIPSVAVRIAAFVSSIIPPNWRGSCRRAKRGELPPVPQRASSCLDIQPSQSDTLVLRRTWLDLARDTSG